MPTSPASPTAPASPTPKFKAAGTARTNSVDNKTRVTVKVAVPDLVASVIELAWTSGINAAREKVTITAPHWKDGEDVIELSRERQQKFATGSKRPGVYLVQSKGGAKTMTATVRISKSQGQSATGELTARVGSLVFTGSSPTGVGDHVVTLTAATLPDALTHIEGEASFTLKTAQAEFVLSNRPRVELFVVLDTPAAFYTQGVWVETLRLLFKKAGIGGAADAQSAAAKVSTYCHSAHGLKYDTVQGAPHFNGAEAIDGGEFKLMHYLRKQPFDPRKDDGTTVNCYDQAAAVEAIAGAVGVEMRSIFQNPFGFIKPTNLIGVGRCNNPFFTSAGNSKMVSDSDTTRTSFGNHAFVSLTSKVHDACAGPHSGTETVREYLEASIDPVRTIDQLAGAGSSSKPGAAKILYDHLESKTMFLSGVGGVS